MAARKGAARRRRGNGPSPELEAAEHEILFPFREVTLFGPGGEPGEIVVVRAWDIDTWAEATPHLDAMQDRVVAEGGKSATMLDVIRIARPELERLICLTVGWSQAQYREKVHTAEEFLALVEAMWATCLIRPGGGVYPLMIRITGLGTQFALAVARGGSVAPRSPKPSMPLSEPVTPSPTSGE